MYGAYVSLRYDTAGISQLYAHVSRWVVVEEFSFYNKIKLESY